MTVCLPQGPRVLNITLSTVGLHYFSHLCMSIFGKIKCKDKQALAFVVMLRFLMHCQSIFILGYEVTLVTFQSRGNLFKKKINFNKRSTLTKDQLNNDRLIYLPK